MKEVLNTTITGHCLIVDDLGNILLDQCNAIHPQNMARIIARSLANEHNNYINRIAFGNGGTTTDITFQTVYKTPNDGQSPDISTWDSRIYNETFSKIIDDGFTVLNPDIGKDLGSADINTGVRKGGGSVPSSDPVTVPHLSGPGVRSVDMGVISQAIITATINADEPKSQFITDVGHPPGSFYFDEIGLYSAGTSAISTNGYQQIDVGNKVSTDDTGLVNNRSYTFTISVDGGTRVNIQFTTPISGGSGTAGEILYGDLCQAINTGSVAWGMSGINPLPGGATMSITDLTGGTFSTITGSITYGYLTITSGSTGPASSIALDDASWPTHFTLTSFLPAINTPQGGTLLPAVLGKPAGLQNAPTNPTIERERLLAHLIFSPILKVANRSMTIKYTLSISVARSPGH